jgi:hypothetical protein
MNKKEVLINRAKYLSDIVITHVQIVDTHKIKTFSVKMIISNHQNSCVNVIKIFSFVNGNVSKK